MRPLVAIVGRPNVGKSTLFNRLVGERRAIVLDTPGVTRDRHYGEADWEGRHFDVVDTGGFEPEAETGVVAAMRQQAMMAIEEADVVVFVADGRDGLLEADREVITILRRANERVVYAVNKIDSPKQEGLVADFYGMGIEQVHPISAEHGRGIGEMLDEVIELLPDAEDEDEGEEDDADLTRVAIVGRPNVGKSTLVNRLLREERMIVDNVAGTTRDAVDAKLTLDDGREFLLIDTAGLRRKGRIPHHTSEGFSVMRTLRAMDRCHVAVVLIDATEGVTDQDARIIGLTQTKGRALVLVVNKWDAVEKDAKTAQRFSEQMAMKLPFVAYAPVLFMSGLTGLRVHKLMDMVEKVRAAHQLRVPTGPLNRWLEQCVARHQPPVVKNRRVKLYYATQVRNAPPAIVVSCNDPEAVHFSYERYMLNQLRESFDFEGTTIRLIFRAKTNKNPFVQDDD